jgi:hypothetical protein
MDCDWTTRELIARGPVCQVERCACGTLHVTIGPFTLRLEPEVLASMWTTLGVAVQRIADVRRAARAPASTGALPS